jgi:membrane-bound lytic murein transglycosylase D
MLKRRRLKARNLSYGLLLIAAPYNGQLYSKPYTATPYTNVFANALHSKSKLKLLHADTIIRQAFDSSQVPLSENAISYIANAPKIELNRNAVKFVNKYIKENDELLTKVEDKSKNSLRIIENILLQNDLPIQLKYLAVIESGLKKTAVSKVGAVGPWQLMPTTARELGLKVSGKYDERKHLYKSTKAAAKYLKSLYAIYGDWLLVIAAYNSGPTKVFSAIKKSGSRNFWKLQYFLPAETRAHVKRFIGTHYFFEEEGSETTLTKAEILAHNKKVLLYLQERDCALEKLAATAALQAKVIDNVSINVTTNTTVKEQK